MDELQKMQAVCYYLIGKCIETEAEKLTIKQEGVKKDGEYLGDWEIVVRKKRPSKP